MRVGTVDGFLVGFTGEGHTLVGFIKSISNSDVGVKLGVGVGEGLDFLLSTRLDIMADVGD